MADKPILEYEPLPARGLRRKTVIALLAASAGVAIVAGGVVYRLSQPAPAVAVSPPAPLPVLMMPGKPATPPATMPWTPSPAQRPTEDAHGG